MNWPMLRQGQVRELATIAGALLIALGTTTTGLAQSKFERVATFEVISNLCAGLPLTDARCVSTTLRHQAVGFSDFSPLSPAAC